MICISHSLDLVFHRHIAVSWCNAHWQNMTAANRRKMVIYWLYNISTCSLSLCWCDTAVNLWQLRRICLIKTYFLQHFHNCSVLQESQEEEGVNAKHIRCDYMHNGHTWSVLVWFSPGWPEFVTHFTRNWHDAVQTERISIRNLLCRRFDAHI